MNVLDRALWLVACVFPAAPSVPWLDVPHGDGPIGPAWPHDRGAVPTAALLAVAELGAVSPAVQAFYADPAAHTLTTTTRWRAGARGFGWLWARAFARRWGQLELPLDDGPVTNAVWRDPDGGRWWVRTFVPSGRVFFVSRFDLVGPHVRIVFPVPGGAWVALVRATVVDGALMLDEEGGTPGGPGLYLVPTGGKARYVAAVREAIALRPNGAGLAATHTIDLFGVRVLTLSYAIEASAVSPRVMPDAAPRA